jgi:UDP:flavonoid glycosyltransferase YjiC (YdhE family)
MTPKKILFANVPLDGHFNPLTTLAVHLLKQGHDVRWYTGIGYKEKVERLGIRFYPCIKALDFSSRNLEDFFPERKQIKSQVSKLKFDIKNGFVLSSS